ncbi:MAG: DUF4249 domain-containing protein [Bacteroidales bacterium]|nr:DUF4249 domain-containing protein [Bacteroidales bacterium]
MSKPGYNIKFLFSILFVMLYAGITISCDKELQIEFPDSEGILVVEGWIELGKAPNVLLSYTAPYFTEIDSVNLRDYAETKAKVTVFSETEEDILILKPNDKYFPPYYYFSTELFGHTGNSYNLRVEYIRDNIQYVATAHTTIPELVEPDSVWFELEPGLDSLGLIWLTIKDNPDEKNYYRTLVKRQGKDKKFVPTFTNVFSDDLFNGEELTISLSKGNASILEVGGNRFFHLGDTIILKFCSIDKEYYDFWNTLQGQIVTSANPFAASNARVASNIKNGIGVWGGYAASYDTVITK